MTLATLPTVLPAGPLTIAVTGTDTGVGKSYVTAVLLRALRARGRKVWVHKPIACGGWEQGQAEDARFLLGLCGDEQPPASVCPLQFPQPASPHVAAAAAQQTVTMAALIAGVERCRATPALPHDLIVEGIGGLLVPVTSQRETVADLLSACQLPVIIVTRPHLGTLNHTALTVSVAQQRGIRILGLVLNAHEAVDDSLAVRTASEELPLVTGVPLLATLRYRPHTQETHEAEQLADALLLARLPAS
jgi:dethiobiotin synthetase